MIFVGIDLAWSERNGSGVAFLRGDKNRAEFIEADICYSDEEISDYIIRKVGRKNAFIGIDAPLIVPNENGERFVEKLVRILFGKYNAYAHPVNRKRLSRWSGKIRGEEISKKLEKIGFKHDPYIKKFEEKRKFFEVFPHPSMVVIFGLNEILKYKAKSKRDYNLRLKEFKRYQGYLKELERSKPPLFLPEEITHKNVELLRGKALKDYEDILDAIFCAYIAYYCWYKPENCEVLGNMIDGYILTPIFPFMKRLLSCSSFHLSLLEGV